MGEIVDLAEYKERREREEKEKIQEEIREEIEYVKTMLELIHHDFHNEGMQPIDFTWEPYDFPSLDLSGSLDGYE